MTKLLNNSREFEEVLRSQDGVMMLFYADWCPFSRDFLPVFEKTAQTGELPCMRIMIDGNSDLFDRYSVSVYPTVIFFKSGMVSKRLDGTPSVGLDERQLTALMKSCASE